MYLVTPAEHWLCTGISGCRGPAGNEESTALCPSALGRWNPEPLAPLSLPGHVSCLIFKKRRMGLKLDRVNLYVLEPLVKPLKTVPFLSFPQKEDVGVHPFRAGILSVMLLQSVATVPGTQ